MAKFRSYLRGMETELAIVAVIGEVKFRSYLRGMETSIYRRNTCSKSEFRSYLRGMETNRVPYNDSIYSDSDPTYEAWKHTVKKFFP